MRCHQLPKWKKKKTELIFCPDLALFETQILTNRIMRLLFNHLFDLEYKCGDNFLQTKFHKIFLKCSFLRGNTLFFLFEMEFTIVTETTDFLLFFSLFFSETKQNYFFLKICIHNSLKIPSLVKYSN